MYLFPFEKAKFLGLVGIAGNGRDELVEVLTRLCKPTVGKNIFRSEDVSYNSNVRFKVYENG
jgi:ABC-type uncharacterized transport system ATPase subunit